MMMMMLVEVGQVIQSQGQAQSVSGGVRLSFNQLWLEKVRLIASPILSTSFDVRRIERGQHEEGRSSHNLALSPLPASPTSYHRPTHPHSMSAAEGAADNWADWRGLDRCWCASIMVTSRFGDKEGCGDSQGACRGAYIIVSQVDGSLRGGTLSFRR